LPGRKEIVPRFWYMRVGCFRSRYRTMLISLMTPTSLTAGYYSSQMLSFYYSGCSAGTYSSSDGMYCMQCSTGYYSLPASSVCLICPAGKYTTDNWNCVSCSSGTYSLPGASTCLPCLRGTSSDSASSSCTLIDTSFPCRGGQYQVGITCADCPAGYYSSGYTCYTCGGGTFSVAGSATCTACSPNTYSLVGASTCTSCPFGQYSGTQYSYCNGPCGPGYFYLQSYGCISCPAGYFSDYTTNTYECDQCPAGTVSSAGSSTCTICEAYSYAVAGSNSCQSCRNTTLTGGATCITSVGAVCPSGYYRSAGGICVQAPAGYLLDSSARNLYVCPAGCSSQNGSLTCDVTCPAGYISRPGGHCKPCPSGYYYVDYYDYVNSGWVGSCSQCPPNTFSTAGSTGCTNCAAGYQNQNWGQSTCSLCPVGYAGGGGGYCNQCYYGSYAPLPGMSSCTWCPPGTYKSGSSPFYCQAVQSGYYAPSYQTTWTSWCLTSVSVGAITCTSVLSSGSFNCPAGGTYYNSVLRTCVSSPPGYIAPANNDNLYICAVGTYSTAKTSACLQCTDSRLPGSAHCTAMTQWRFCTPGTIIAGTSCAAVPGGYYNPFSSSTSYYACPAGSYSVGNATLCSSCPAGKYGASYGLTSPMSCTPCPSGWYASGVASTQCSACYPGSYSLPGAAHCSPCSPGSYSSQQNASYCTTVPVGSYYPLTGASSLSQLPNCVSSTLAGAVSCGYLTSSGCSAGQVFHESACRTIPAGYISVGSSNGGINTIYQCGRGSFSTWGQSSCTVCATSTLQGGSTCNSASNSCAQGLVAAGSNCVNSSYGYIGYKGNAYSCGPGIDTDVGSRSCVDSSSKYYGTHRIVETDIGMLPASCSNGTYPTYTRGVALPVCAYCSMGRNTYLETGTCDGCRAGTFSVVGMSGCQSCPAGHECLYGYQYVPSLCYEPYYRTSNGTTDMSGCTYCSYGTIQGGSATNCASKSSYLQSGLHCRAGSFYYSATCSRAPPGYVVPYNDSVILYACPVGSYSAVYGSSACTLCAAGTYSSGAASVCTPCPAGAYQSGTGQAYCNLCPRGYTSDIGAKECVTCPPGTTAPRGSPLCIAVDAGYYAALPMHPVPCLARAVASGALHCRLPSVTCLKGQFVPAGAHKSGHYYSYYGYYGSQTYDDDEITNRVDLCANVPAGYYNPTTSGNSIFICPSGSFSLGSSPFCQSCIHSIMPGAGYCGANLVGCLAGHYNNGSCSIVPAGFYNPVPGHGSYYACPPGRFSSSGAKRCTNCHAGYYSDEPAAASCSACPAGKTSTSRGSQACADCGPGYYSFTGDYCRQCPPGTYSSTIGASKCTLVSSGFYNPLFGQTSQQLRCFMSYTSGAVNCDQEAAVPCEAGYVTINGVCASVPAGYRNPFPETSIIYICEAWSYSTGGAIDCDVCVYATTPGAAFCSSSLLLCGEGFYRDDFGNCNPVPAGFFKPGEITANVYYSCPYGTYSDSQAGHCTVCRQRMSYDVANINAGTCDACPVGYRYNWAQEDTVYYYNMNEYYEDDTGNSEDDVDDDVYTDDYSSGRRLYDEMALYTCQLCPSGTRVSRRGCITCPANTYSTYPVNADINQCIRCPWGSFSSRGSSTCTLIPASRWQSGGVGQANTTCAYGVKPGLGQFCKAPGSKLSAS
jgi:hypothetical protein